MKGSAKLLAVLLGSCLAGGVMAEELTLDDFSDADEVSSIGSRWEGFTDQVMGGKSEMQTRFLSENGEIFLRMEGEVSVENRGGFIQVRLLLNDDRDFFDASSYRGLQIRYRTSNPPGGTVSGGTGSPSDKAEGGYYLHIRTSQNRFPWAHYAAKIPASSEWSTASVPWKEFEKQYTLAGNPKIRKLKSVAVTAERAEFSASIDIGYIGLY